MIPKPPGSDWASLTGNGLRMSKTRKQTNARSRIGRVRGSVSTESSMPATSSITITPGSFWTTIRSILPAAQAPTRETPTRITARDRFERGTSHRSAAAKRLPAVPGASGTNPAPPAVARPKAKPSVSRLAHEFVPFNLDDPDICEPARAERAHHDPFHQPEIAVEEAGLHAGHRRPAHDRCRPGNIDA